MNKNEIAKNKMYKTVIALLDEKINSFTGYTRFVQEIGTFKGYNHTLDGLIKLQNKSSTGETEAKNNGLEALIEKTVKLSRKALIYAQDINDPVLQKLFNIRTSNLRSAEVIMLADIDEICTVLQGIDPAALADHAITPEDLKVFREEIEKVKKNSTSTNTVQNTTETATVGLKACMKNMDASLYKMDDMIESHYEDSQPLLVEEYFKSRGIDSPAVRHSGYHFVFTDVATHQVVEGVQVRIKDQNKAAVSDIHGDARLIAIKSGTYHVDVTAKGYAPQSLTLTVIRGKVVDLDVALVRV